MSTVVEIIQAQSTEIQTSPSIQIVQTVLFKFMVVDKQAQIKLQELSMLMLLEQMAVF